MELIDPNNAAVTKFTDLPPRLIEEIHDDPNNAAPFYRSMAAINDYELYTMRESLTPAQRMELSNNFAKRGGLEMKQVADQQAAAQFSLEIHIPSVGDVPSSSRIIEVVNEEKLQLPEVVGGLPEKRQVHQPCVRSGGFDENDDIDYQDTD